MKNTTNASRSYGRLAGQQLDEILIDLKLSIGRIVRIFADLTKVQCYYNVTNAFQVSFFG